MDAALLDRFRTAVKATLWCWALYWPGGGLLLVYGGLDPVGIAVILLGLVSFLLLMLSGALSTTSSRSLRELLIERPLYLVAALIVMVAVVPVASVVENAGLILFSGAFAATTALALWRLAALQASVGGSPYRARTDQAMIALGLGLVLSMLLFIDAALVDGRIPMSSTWVAIANWTSLLYPALVLVGTRGLREPLRNPLRRAREGVAEAGAPRGRRVPAAVLKDE